MNQQPVVKNGYYMHYNKNKIYKLLDFAMIDTNPATLENSTKEYLAIYQPQYTPVEVPNHTLWARPKNMFFENMDSITPRFEYLGRTQKEVIEIITQKKLNIELDFKKNNGLNKNIAETIFKNYSILAFALHSETLESQIIFYKNGSRELLISPEKEFFKKSEFDSENKSISDYLDGLRKG